MSYTSATNTTCFNRNNALEGVASCVLSNYSLRLHYIKSGTLTHNMTCAQVCVEKNNSIKIKKAASSTDHGEGDGASSWMILYSETQTQTASQTWESPRVPKLGATTIREIRWFKRNSQKSPLFIHSFICSISVKGYRPRFHRPMIITVLTNQAKLCCSKRSTQVFRDIWNPVIIQLIILETQ